MSTWKRAGREQVRIFFTQNQHIAIVIGKKPRRCAEIERKLGQQRFEQCGLPRLQRVAFAAAKERPGALRFCIAHRRTIKNDDARHKAGHRKS